MSDAIQILLPFLGVLAVVVFLRVRSKGAFEIKTPDIVLAAVPVALWLVASGRIESLSVGDLTIKAFQAAAAQPAGDDAQPLGDALPVETMRADEKGAVTRIPDLLAQRTQALTFHLGARGYVPWAVQQYFDQLTVGPDLQWVVIDEADGRFWGLADARTLESATRSQQFSMDEFVRHLNEGDAADREWLARNLPGFVPADEALAAGATRQDALQRFNATPLNALPALDADGRLRGLVRRDTLVTGLLADVTARLDAHR